MSRVSGRMRLALPWALLWATALAVPIVGSGVDLTQRRIDQLAFPYAWSLVGWEGRHIPSGLGLVVAQIGDSDGGKLTEQVLAFLADERASVGDAGAPRLVASAVTSGLKRSGAPTLGANVFPPVTLAVGEAPRLLVVSPRERIWFSHSVVLDGAMPMTAAEALEEQVQRLGVSALVLEAIALGTYPVLIPSDTPARSALQTVAHEWTHIALFPSVLGLAYGSSGEARAINETTADLVAEEVRAGWATDSAGGSPARPVDQFIRNELRSIRINADALLAQGDIDGAERYMEAARLELVTRGYRIRRLNQAYFAFHGSYAEGPAPSTEIPDGLRSLRARSSSLAEFLARVGSLTSVEDLRRAIRD